MSKPRILIIITTVVLVSFAAVVVVNLDVFIRLGKAFKAGTLSGERIRYELAAYNLTRREWVEPIQKRTSTKDGMLQLYVPEGEFRMGKLGKPGRPDENSPDHIVYLEAFWIDHVEVSNEMYAGCVEQGGCVEPVLTENPYYGRWVYRHLPVILVSWYQAQMYCEWTGRRLPTEAEWEKAARGTDERLFPWGNEAPTPRLANYAESLIGEPVSVYRYPLGASPYGALNMAGNVREWLADWYSDSYYSESPYSNPAGPESGIERSMRSGAYDADANEIFTTTRYKHEPQSAGLSRGFRCAESAK